MKYFNPKLSHRMKVFLSYAITNRQFWDICCDHGYVGLKAMESGLFTKVHFNDQLPHVIKKIELLLNEQKSLSLKTPFKLHDFPGEEISEDVTGTMLIAGVGGLTIKNILSGLHNKNYMHADRLLLSPHSDIGVLIDLLNSEDFSQRYSLIEKIEIPERKRLRLLYVLDRKL